MSKQKFPMYATVKVKDGLKAGSLEYQGEVIEFDRECGFSAIVEGTYSQLCNGGPDESEYSLYRLNPEGDKIINTLAWYNETDLTLQSADDATKIQNLRMVEQYLDHA